MITNPSQERAVGHTCCATTAGRRPCWSPPPVVARRRAGKNRGAAPGRLAGARARALPQGRYSGAVTPSDHGSPLRGTGPGGRKEGVLAPARPRSRRGGVQRRRRLLPAKGRRRSVLRKEKEKKERRGGGWTGSSGGVPRWRRRPRWPVAMGGRCRAAQREREERMRS